MHPVRFLAVGSAGLSTRLAHHFVPLTIRLAFFSLAIGSPGLSAQTIAAGTLDQPDERADAVKTMPAVKVAADAPEPLKPGAATGSLLENIPLAETPYSITALPAEFLRNRDTRVLDDMLRNLPGVQSAPVTSAFGNGQINALSRGKNAALLLDGFNTLGGGSFVPVELIESFELLSGPSALEKGFSGASGGTVNMTLKRPTSENFGLVEFGATQFGGKNVLVDVNRVLDSGGKFAVRINLAAEDLQNHLRGAKGNFRLGGLSATWRPFDGTAITADGFYGLRHDTPQAYISLARDLDAEPRRIDPRLFTGYPYEYTNSEMKGSGLQFIQELPAGWTLKAVARTADSVVGGYYTEIYDFDGATGDGILVAAGRGFGTDMLIGRPRSYTDRSFGAKAYGSVDTGPFTHDLVIGFASDRGLGFYCCEESDGRYVEVPTNLYSGPLVVPRPEEIPFEPSAGYLDIPYGQSRSYGGYIQDRISIGERWALWLGFNFARYSSYTHYPVSETELDESRSSLHKPVSSYALSYKLTGNLMLYGSTQQVVAQGGVAPDRLAQPDILNPLEQLPYKVTQQYEVGAKWNREGALWTAAYFNIEEPFEYLRDEAGGTRLVQDGRRINKGVELSVQGQVFEGLQAQAGVQLLTARVTETNDPNVKGKSIAGVAERVANATLEYTLPAASGVTLSTSVYHTGAFPLNDRNTVDQSGYTTVDLGVRWSAEFAHLPFTLRATLANATNEYYLYSANSVTIGVPRTFKLSANTTF